MRIAYLDGPRLRRSLTAACAYTELQRRELNRINVFPVPDGDTGTNLALTVRAIGDHLRRDRSRGVSEVADEVAEAAILGARGNSGMMLSHFLLGFAGALEGRRRITTREFTVALEAGVAALYDAIDRPVEGTILTVMRETAEAARSLDDPDFLPYMQALLDHADASLARTPELLPALRDAGVVDAGAKGFVHLLEGVTHYMEQGEVGEAARSPERATEEESAGGGAPAVPEAAADELHGSPAAGAAFDPASERFRFCTEGLVRGGRLPTGDEARAVLREHGDSLVAIRSGEVLKVHIHTDDPEAVFRYLKTLGELVTHKAEDMRVQHRALAGSSDGATPSAARRPVVVVTESAQDLPEEVLRAHGIRVVPLLLLQGDEVLRDGFEITASEFHEMVDGHGELPTTSQPAPADFLEVFRSAAEEGEEILYVGLSAALSGTFASGEAAAARFDDVPVHRFDSRAASILQGLLVLKGAELAEAGAAPAEIVSTLGRIRDRSGIFFTVDTFDRLVASGRVGKGKGWLAGRLGLKPILELSQEGVVHRAGKAFGRNGVMRRVLRLVAERVPPGSARVRFGLVHVGRPEVLEPLRARLHALYGPEVEILSSPATPVLATHLGTGAWGLGYMAEDA